MNLVLIKKLVSKCVTVRCQSGFVNIKTKNDQNVCLSEEETFHSPLKNKNILNKWICFFKEKIGN